MSGPTRWLRLSVLLAVMLAFADASIVVLALPQIVDRLHTSISHVAWVIVAYNLSLIAGAATVVPFAPRLPRQRTLVAGLAVFGLASLAAGSAGSLGVLIVARCAQGAGGALLLCSSLPLFETSRGTDQSPLAGWAAAAALGAAIGPAIGGLLTQLFDWRAIFFAQAPVAALAAWAVSAASGAPSRRSARAQPADATPADATPGEGRWNWAAASLALALVSAALIGALFLVTVLMIDVWLLTPLATAAVVSVVPAATVVAERAGRGRVSPLLTGAGAVTLAAGLAGLALVSHRQLGWVVVALALCGTGLGLTVPPLTAASLRSPGLLLRRAARTIAAHDAGLVLGLLILTPVFVNNLDAAPKRAIPPITTDVLAAPIPILLKLQIGAGLLAADKHASPGRLPDIAPAFDRAASSANGPTAARLVVLQQQVQDLIERAATRSFRQPLLYCALFALMAIPALVLGRWPAARRSLSRAPTEPG
ncbi:MAG TPA: MFS transporter [Solirubrobacteraceae bacterium]|jgi:predicted MFS family arabinose efflux permease|nr:MFS transporter [Solirubrobacteraceae bacterium]